MTPSTLTPPSQAAPGKARDVQVVPIAPGTLALRSRSWNRLRFEIEYALERELPPIPTSSKAIKQP